MMLVTAVVQPYALDDVRAGLERPYVAGTTVSEVSGHAVRVRTGERGADAL